MTSTPSPGETPRVTKESKHGVDLQAEPHDVTVQNRTPERVTGTETPITDAFDSNAVYGSGSLADLAIQKMRQLECELAAANEQLAAERALRERAEHWQHDFTEACRQREQAEARLKVAEELLREIAELPLGPGGYCSFPQRDLQERVRAAIRGE